MPSRRRLARVVVLQTLFESQARSIDTDASLLTNVQELGGEAAVDVEYAQALLAGVLRKRTSIEESITKHAPEWPLDRMDTLTRSILLLGSYELLFIEKAPPPVVMNEAIEIAKEYGPEESPKFVNGVLNAIAKGKEHSTGV